MQVTKQRLIKYLEEVTGSEPELQWNLAELTAKLPLYLRSRYTLSSLNIFGRRCLLAIESSDWELGTPAEYAAHSQTLQRELNESVAIVLPVVPSYARNRMVQSGTQFIVPGSQMFLPAMMIDLRERFSTPAPKSTTGKSLTPTTQCILFYHILRRPLNGMPLTEIAEHVGYSKMNISRAKDELEAAGLCSTTRQGRSVVLKFSIHGRELWEKALPLLKSPVRKCHWVDWQEIVYPALPAGMTALSHSTMIADDRIPTYALLQNTFRTNLEKGLFRGCPAPSEANVQLEAWSYNPLLLAEGNQVDPLSLYLSLKENYDERVQQQLETLMTEVKWKS